MIDGRHPDLVFQKSLDTFAKRHHIRIWKLASTYNGREVWVGAATHDIAVEHTKTMTKWTHRIDPHIDRERDWIESDLLRRNRNGLCGCEPPGGSSKGRERNRG